MCCYFDAILDLVLFLIQVWVRVSQFWFEEKIRFLKRLHCIHSGCEKWPRRQIWRIVSKWQFVTFKMKARGSTVSEKCFVQVFFTLINLILRCIVYYVDNQRIFLNFNFHCRCNCDSFHSVAKDSKACMEIHSPSCRVTTFSKNMSSRELCISAVAHLIDDFVQRFWAACS